jgi:hypothetical protein
MVLVPSLLTSISPPRPVIFALLIYTPKGNVRLSFVDHGENFAKGENGMAELTDRVKQIYDAYANDTTYFDRQYRHRANYKPF